jgi:hypothetical protein
MKKIFSLIFIIILIAHTGFAASSHLIGGQFGISLPGEKEITDIFPSISINTSIYSYNIGIEYNFKFLSYLSLGAGCNYIFKNYILDFTPNQITYNYNALEPYSIVRAYLQLMSGIDIFAGTALGYGFLINSKITESSPDQINDINGSGLTVKFCGGISYEGYGFTTMLEGGYKIAAISPLNIPGAGEIKNADGSSAAVNFGGPFINILVFLSFENFQEQKADNEKQTEKVSETKTEESSNTQTYLGPVEQPDKVSEKKEILNSAEFQEQKKESEINTKPAESYSESIQENSDNDTEGIIILSPGGLEASELEKYISSKRKHIMPEEEEEENEQEEVEFDYDQSSGVLLVESELKDKVEKAGFVLVERAGFISNNFTEDGFIFTKENEKMFLSQNNFAYIRLTVGKGAKKGKEFIIYDDSENVIDNISGLPMGKMINILGVARVINNVEDNIFKVQITKAYDPIKNEMKIKARNDIKDYHKSLLKKVRKKNLDVEGYIIKVKNDIPEIKNKDIVYLNIGVSKGILPGEKLNIYRKIFNPKEDKEEKFHKIGSLLIINSVQYSSVGMITQQNEIIKVGDIVKTK